MRELEMGNTIKLISLEKEFNEEIRSGKTKYKIRGKIDRVDKINGEIRIIDYKTGKKLYSKDLVLKNEDELGSEKSIYNLQLIFYMIGLFKEMQPEIVRSGIISLKNTKEGVLEGNFEGETRINNEKIKIYEKRIITMINQILDRNLTLSLIHI